MLIVFDMDNTLVDELGQTARPGIRGVLTRIAQAGHTMMIYTSSTRERAERILDDLKLAPFFARLIAREDYDPGNTGRIKDVKSLRADWFIDDDPKQIAAVKKQGVKVFQVAAYRRRVKLEAGELEALEKAVLGRR